MAHRPLDAHKRKRDTRLPVLGRVENQVVERLTNFRILAVERICAKHQYEQRFVTHETHSTASAHPESGTSSHLRKNGRASKMDMVVWPRASRTVLRVVLELLGGGRVAKEEGEGGEDILSRRSKGLRLRQRLRFGHHEMSTVRSLVRETVGAKKWRRHAHASNHFSV